MDLAGRIRKALADDDFVYLAISRDDKSKPFRASFGSGPAHTSTVFQVTASEDPIQALIDAIAGANVEATATSLGEASALRKKPVAPPISDVEDMLS